MEVPIQYDGDYVLTSGGSKDFGEISEEIAKIIKREKGKIRLEKGFQINGKGFGEAHIERTQRIKELKQNGYNSARDFIEFIAKDYDSIYQGIQNNLIIVKLNNTANLAFLSLKQNSNDKDVYWTVESAFISRRDYLNGIELLWKK